MALVMLGMAAMCAPCAFAAWRTCSAKTMTTLMGMSLGTAVANLVIVLSMNWVPHSGHEMSQHAAVGALAEPNHSVLMLGVMALEIVTAGIAGVRVRGFSLAA